MCSPESNIYYPLICATPSDPNINNSQLQQGKGSGEAAYNGMFDCLNKIVKQEG